MVGVRSAAWRMGLWACAMWAALGAATARAEVVERTMTAGTEQRSFLLSRPSGATTPLPVVIALHGAGESAEGFMGYLGLEETAARNRFVAVYPQGIGRVWNDGRPAAMRLKAMLTPGDDVTFLVTLTQQLVAEGIADPNRIYMMGISNGGFMVERMACEHADLYAAFSVIMATAPANYREQCRPSRPVPIMFIHGTADPVIAWDGFWTPMGATLSAPDSAQLYAALERLRRIAGAGSAGPQPPRRHHRLRPALGGLHAARRSGALSGGAGRPPVPGAGQDDARAGHGLPRPAQWRHRRRMESWALFSRHSLAPPTPVAAPAAVPLPARPPQKPRSSRAQAVQ